MIRSTTPLDPLTLPRPGWGLWGAWVLATILAATLGLALADMPVLGTSARDFQNDYAIVPLFLWGCGMVVGVGTLLGLAQGWVLGKWLRLRHRGWWLVATWVGFLLAQILVILDAAARGSTCGPFIAMLPGFVFGAVQYGVLRGRVPGAELWVLANGVAWLLALGAGELVRTLFFSPSASVWPFHPAGYALSWGIGWAISAVIFGAITGGALILILRQPVSVPARHKTAPLEPLEPLELFDP